LNSFEDTEKHRRASTRFSVRFDSENATALRPFQWFVERPSRSIDVMVRDTGFEPIVVTRGSEQTSALRQIQGRVRPPILFKSARELGAKIRGISGAAAITAHQQLLTVSETASN
jgi:hypothetical protein